MIPRLFQKRGHSMRLWGYAFRADQPPLLKEFLTLSTSFIKKIPLELIFNTKWTFISSVFLLIRHQRSLYLWNILVGILPPCDRWYDHRPSVPFTVHQNAWQNEWTRWKLYKYFAHSFIELWKLDKPARTRSSKALNCVETICLCVCIMMDVLGLNNTDHVCLLT